jgi:hypothetical protein
MNYLGDYADNSVVDILFTTHDKDGAAVAPSSSFENTDIRIYKNGSATQKTSVNGVTMTSPFGALVGLHLLQIDTGNDTGDVGFWAIGSEYVVVLSPDETVDTENVIKVIGSFSLERAGASVAMLKNASYGLVTLESIVSSNETDLTTLLSRLVGTILAGNHTAQSGDSYAIVNGAHGLVSIQDDIDEILLDTAQIGVAGAGLTGVGLSAAAVDSILDETVEGALTLRHITKILLAYMAGRATGGGTVTISFRDQANTKDRIVMTVNTDGNRSNVVVDGT